MGTGEVPLPASWPFGGQVEVAIAAGKWRLHRLSPWAGPCLQVWSIWGEQGPSGQKLPLSAIFAEDNLMEKTVGWDAGSLGSDPTGTLHAVSWS